jgi:hypothetical protein
MSLLSEFNLWASTIFPAWIWAYLEIVLGLGVAIATFVRRSTGTRFSTSAIQCSVDSITTRVGQIGLSFVGTIAFLVVIDGITSNTPARIFVVMLLAGYFMIQVRIIHLAIISHGAQK